MSAKLLGKGLYALGLSLFVVLSLFIGQVVAGLTVSILPLNLNVAVESTLIAAIGYILGLMIAIGVPVVVSCAKIDRKLLGIERIPSWSDIGLGILSVLPYYILSGVALWVGIELFNVIDPDVGQQIPFDNLNLRIEYLVAFVTLVIFAPLAEELLFRGYFLGRLNQRMSKWASVIITALIFGLLHLPGFGEAGFNLQWSVAADTFAMGLVAGTLRQISGSIWAGVLLHAFKNGIAYYFLFIAPLSLGS